MSSFGLNTAADFFQKLRHERTDFLHSGCLDPRHALNAVMTGYHLCEWVFPELSHRSNFPYRNLADFREALSDMTDSPIAEAGRITHGTQHFKQDRIRTGEQKGLFQPNMVQPNASDVTSLWLERQDGRRQQVEEFIEELVQFWDRYFKDHGLHQTAAALGRSSARRCPCGHELIDIDNRGDILTGCSRCNVWWPLNKPPVRLSEEDLLALRRSGAEGRHKPVEPEPSDDYEI
jgi:hypothetical protein